MRVLFIGGTGTISTAISKKLIKGGKHELYLINRGNNNAILPTGFKSIVCDINNEAEVAGKIKDLNFDVVADFIAFTPDQLERDFRLFNEKTKQFIFISSASAYQKPLSNHNITESTPLANPYWEYSRNKIACEDYLMKVYREKSFPVTIVRPSHTYDERSIPLGVHGNNGSWSVAKRMLEGKPVIIHGDGTSLWAMTHNSDFADGFIGLMGNIHAIGESVHITTDEMLTWNQIYMAIANTLGVELKPYYVSSSFLDKCSEYDFKGGLIGDKANTVVFDNSKLKSLVPGFTAKVRYDQGIKNTIQNILDNPELQKTDPDFDKWCDKVIATLDKAAIEIK
ncbi:MAG: SDR family oxidoreductase [Oscillospiraceae bacterium]|nr:SDR family oxidoreductase [Oscillospiraceae bacterium]